jgi:hypothetical protein
MPTPPPPPAGKRPFTTLDLVLTPVLSVLLLVLCGLALVMSMFAAMGMDSCGINHECSATLIGLAYACAWGGIGTAVLVALVGVLVSAVKRKTMFGWPIAGIGVLVLGTVVGGLVLMGAVSS